MYDRSPSGFYFNKVLSILHHRFKIGLPHNWYRWGDEVVRSCLSPHILWQHDYESTEVLLEQGTVDISLQEEWTEKIDSVIEEFPLNDPERLGDMVYSYAPYEFQRVFRALRNMIDQKVDGSMSDLRSHNLVRWKGDAVKEYSYLPFVTKDMNDSFILWNEAFDIVLSHGDLPLLTHINETFWFDVCYHLRLDSNENVPDKILVAWEEHLPYDAKRLKDQLVDDCIKLTEAGATFSTQAMAVIEKKIESDREYLELIDDLYDGQDQDVELSEMRRTYSYRSRPM
jgi:hypothetical protein